MGSKRHKDEPEREPAFDALKRLYQNHGGYYATKPMLAEMLKDGHLKAMAGQRVISIERSPTAASRNRTEAETEEHVILGAGDFGWVVIGLRTFRAGAGTTTASF